MALRDYFSFDAMDTAMIPALFNTSASATVTAAGRHNNGLHLAGAGSVAKTYDNQATWIVGQARRFNTSGAIGTSPILALIDGSTTQVDVRVNASGNLIVTRNGTTLGTASGSLLGNQYYYVELKAKIDPTVGTIDLYVNGASVLSLTGQNTRATANSFAQIVKLQGANNGSDDVDDVYIYDGSGSDHNAVEGDLTVSAKLPASAGNYQQGTPSASTLLANDQTTTPDTATNSNSLSTGQIDTYVMGTSSGTIKGAVLRVWCNKSDTGAMTVVPFIRIGTTDYPQSAQNPSTTYGYFSTALPNDPSTSAAWASATALNNAEMGAKAV